MLLIAMPKSASTSLAVTISKMCRLNYKLGIPNANIDIPCDSFKEMQKYHTNMAERSPLFLKQIIYGNKILFKEHLLPTYRHLQIMDKIKGRIVILLRSPEDALDCYKRLFDKNGKKYNESKLLKDLALFHDRYIWWASNKKHVIHFYFKDLILNYRSVMKKILKHYRLRGQIIPMEKLCYTGIGRKRIDEEINAIDSTT